MPKSLPPYVAKFPAAKQRRLDQLLEKNSEGTITAKEKTRLQQLVAEAEQLMAANAKRLAAFAHRATKRAPADATPVTVWIHAEHVER